MLVKPLPLRQGKSRFLPLKDKISERLNNGETLRMIYLAYPELHISYPQFAKYINKYCGEYKNKSVHKQAIQNKENTPSKQTGAKEDTPPPKNLNPAELKELRKQSSLKINEFFKDNL